MLDYRGYVGVSELEDGAFAGRVAGLRDMVTFEGSTYADVEKAFRASVDDYLAFCAERGEPPDRPLSAVEREGLWRFNVEAFQRFCDEAGERAADRGSSQKKVADLLADD